MRSTPHAQQDNVPLVLTIDVGSSSLRANLFTGEARQLTDFEAHLSYRVTVSPDGGVEIDPHELLDCLSSAIDSVLNRAGESARHIRGVGMCSLVSNVMGVDEQGQPTTPIYTWADTRCAAEAAELRAELDEAEIHERTGCPIHTSYLPARLLWLQRSAPEVYARTARWITIGEWLQFNLFWEIGQSLSVASWSGLLNRHTLQWDDVLLSFLEVDIERLPPLVDAGDAMQGLTGEYAQRWPALRDVPWFPCVGDGVTSNLGSGCSTPDQLAMQVGTSGAIRAVLPNMPGAIPPGLWCYRVDRESSLLGGALSEGGNLLAWLRDTMNVQDFRALEGEATKMPPDSHGLTLLPFVAGERSPGWHGNARATICGLSLNTQLVDIIRATQEAIAYRFGLVFDLLKSALPPTRQIIASGGALLNSEGWIGVMADVLGHAVTASGEPEASSRGAALLALRSLGIISDFSEAPTKLGRTYQPDMQRHEVYRRAMQRQAELYDALLGPKRQAQQGQ